MTRIVLPAQTVKIDETTGIDPVWYEKLQQINAFVNLFSEVNFATMTTGQVLIWDATTKKFTAGAN
jgi:hypothetical protein